MSYRKHLMTRDEPPSELYKAAEVGTNLAEVGTDLISRKAAINYFVTNVGFHDEDGYPIEDECELRKIWTDYFNGIPTAEPQIIRCKDCKHWIPYDWMFSEMWQSKNIADYPEDEIGCEWSDMSMKANDFCSRAERREVTT